MKIMNRSEYVAFICNQNKEDAVEAGYFEDSSDCDSEGPSTAKYDAIPILTVLTSPPCFYAILRISYN